MVGLVEMGAQAHTTHRIHLRHPLAVAVGMAGMAEMEALMLHLLMREQPAAAAVDMAQMEASDTPTRVEHTAAAAAGTPEGMAEAEAMDHRMAPVAEAAMALTITALAEAVAILPPPIQACLEFVLLHIIRRNLKRWLCENIPSFE